MIFGILDQSGQNQLRVEQHTAMIIPWAQAKLLVYFIQLQIGAYEFQNGKISIPKTLLPPEVPDPTEEQKQIPGNEQLFNMIRALRNQFLANL